MSTMGQAEKPQNLEASQTALKKFLTKGDIDSGHRSRRDANEIIPAIKAELEPGYPISSVIDSALMDFTTDVILGAAWYQRKASAAKRTAIAFIVGNIALVIIIPIFVAWLGSAWASTRLDIATGKEVAVSGAQQYGLLIAQLSSVLTGVFALQKTVSAWYSQQQNYAGWYKCGAELKSLYYGLIKDWSGRISDNQDGFLARLRDDEAKARAILDAERIDFYTRLALPSFDVLDMLTSNKENVVNLVTALVPAATKKNAVAIGTKAILGSGPDRDVSAKEDATDEDFEIDEIDADEPVLKKAALQQDASGRAIKLPNFDQSVVDACCSIDLTKATDIIGMFQGYANFYSWYNDVYKGEAATRNRYPCSDTPVKQARFKAFWDQVEVIFGRKTISAIEFCALMAINLEESSGDLSSAPEKMNPVEIPHGGLAYAFDKIPEKRKQSYNHAPNKKALELFHDKLFVDAHEAKAGAAEVLNRLGGIDARWGSELWPSDVSPVVNVARNGFIMEADFYKFRGRGVIQTTWRSDYILLIDWILKNGSAGNVVLRHIADDWRARATQLNVQADPDRIATFSTNTDWDAAFGEAMTLAAGVAIDSRAKNNYLNSLSSNADQLDGPRTTRGSLLYFAAHINGGGYPDRVAPIMKALMCGVAGTMEASAIGRASRQPEVA